MRRVLLVWVLLSPSIFAITNPALPLATVDTTMPPITGMTRTVNCTNRIGDATDLQNQLNAAVGGDAVVLPHGCVWTGNFIFPVHQGPGYVVVVTDALNQLPPPGTRINPADSPNMARLQLPPGTGEVAVLGNDYQNPNTAARASAHWRFVGLEIAAGSNVPMTYSLVTLDAVDDAGNGAANGLPQYIVFDRVWVHADTLTTCIQRAFRANAANFALVDSYVNQIQSPSAPFPFAGESQTVTVWNSPGPITIVNNYLEASTENVMFGGGFGLNTALWTASDITFEHNYVAKNPAWAPGSATVWNTKNLFELKEGVRVLVTDNVFEYSWQGGQTGFALTMTPRTQQSGWWKNVTDVVVSSNVIRHVGGFVAILVQDDGCVTLNQSSVVNISGTTVTWVSGATFGTNGAFNGGSFAVNGSGSYLFTWTSPTTGTINTDLGDQSGVTFTLICNSEDRIALVNNLVDDVNVSYGTPPAPVKTSGFNNLMVSNNSIIRSDSVAQPAFFFQNNGCYSGAKDLGTNLAASYNILFGSTGADCLNDPNSIFPLVAGSVSVNHNLLVSLAPADQAKWTKWDATSQFSASPTTLQLSTNDTAFGNGSPFASSGVGPDLSCFNESAVRAGTMSGLCPLPAAVAPAIRTGTPRAVPLLNNGRLP